jgi:hypothetical protein
MFTSFVAPRVLPRVSASHLRSATWAAWVLVLGCSGFAPIASARAGITLTFADGVTNPPPSLTTTGLAKPQMAVAETASLVSVSSFAGVFQETLNAQGYTAANNWTLNTNAVALDPNANFNVTAYGLSLNSRGTGFGETMQFSLSPDLAGPTNVPAGSTVTLHWIQLINSSSKINGYGYAIAGQSGYWQFDNGQINGSSAAGAYYGPYYDSFAPPNTYSTPPNFYDFPDYYSGVGTYLNFETVPVWDVYTPGTNGGASTESIDVGDYGVAWGFQVESPSVVPEPSSFLLVTLGAASITLVHLRRQGARPRGQRPEPASPEAESQHSLR